LVRVEIKTDKDMLEGLISPLYCSLYLYCWKSYID